MENGPVGASERSNEPLMSLEFEVMFDDRDGGRNSPLTVK